MAIRQLIVKEDAPGLFELSFSQQAFVVGDIVTRSGDDEQVILSIDSDWLTMEILCIKAGQFMPFGESESNLIRRYEFVRSAAEHRLHPTAFGVGMQLRLAKFVNCIRELLAKHGGRLRKPLDRPLWAERFRKMRDLLLWLSGWLGMFGVQTFHDPVAKLLSMFISVLIYAVIVIAWKQKAV